MTKSVIEGLNRYLADSFVLYVKTLNFHWNVKGRHFHSLHAMFEDQYTELAKELDETAERIRALGAPAPGSLKEFLQLACLRDTEGPLSAEAMVDALLQDHEAQSNALDALIAAAEAEGDSATADYATSRSASHQKTAWMLKSWLS